MLNIVIQRFNKHYQVMMLCRQHNGGAMKQEGGTASLTEKTKFQSTGGCIHARGRNYLLFLVILSFIIALIYMQKNFLLAPPYAVTAYLIVFGRGTKYADIKSVAMSYLVVVASSELIHLLVGTSLIALVANILIVSAFITFTDFSHPPAIALTIFSYIVHDTLSFSISSLLALCIVLVFDVLIKRYAKHDTSRSQQ